MVAMVCAELPAGVSARITVELPDVTVQTTSGGPADGVGTGVAEWLAVGVLDGPLLPPHALAATAAAHTAPATQIRIAAIVIRDQPEWSIAAR